VGSGSLGLISQLESMIALEKLDVPVVRRECLGRCVEGPVVRFAPAGPFFTEIDETSLDDIITQLKTFIAQQDA
jgi:(2Fe-2S) ferredoxin